jgi:hypothetical protein
LLHPRASRRCAIARPGAGLPLKGGGRREAPGGGSQASALIPILGSKFTISAIKSGRRPHQPGAPERTLDNEYGGHAAAMAQRRFGAGIEDVIILPLVLVALAAKKLFQAALSILIHILDYAFPILLQ